MHLHPTILSLVLGSGLLAGCGQTAGPDAASSAISSSRSDAAPSSGLAALLPELIAKTGIPGLQVAVVENGELAWSAGFGVANADDGTPVTHETVFEGASLSKPVLAYLALRMVARGELDLDRPLHELLVYERFADAPHGRALTARLVLSHQTGLPNWGGDPLTFDIAPGTHFGYSGEGYVYLQRVIEAQTGSPLEALARREVFEPLGMKNSSFTWAEGEQPLTLAAGHDGVGKAVRRARPEANAASSLHTTAEDYARFLIALLTGEGLDPDLLRAALQPAVRMRGNERGATNAADIDGKVGWGLGWGIQQRTGEQDGVIWHWGDNGVFRAFVAFRPMDRSGVVYFTNSVNGLSIAQQVLEPVVGDIAPTIDWLAYEQSTAPTWEPRRRALLAEAAGDYGAAIEAFERVRTLSSGDQPLDQRLVWLHDLQRVSIQPVTISHDRLQHYAGGYGPRTLFVRDERLHYQREGRSAVALIPLTQDMFALEGMVRFRLQVVADEHGDPIKLVGHYLGGDQDESPRNGPVDSESASD